MAHSRELLTSSLPNAGVELVAAVEVTLLESDRVVGLPTSSITASGRPPPALACLRHARSPSDD